MKHLNRRSLTFVCALALLGLLAAGCASLAASARGWAKPVGAGDLYLVSTDKGEITGIDRETLTKQWTFPDYWEFDSKSASDTDGIYGTPIVASDGDTVYVADYNGYVYAFRISEALSPQQIESEATKPFAAAYDIGSSVIGGLVLDEANNTLYVAAGKEVHALSSTNLLRRFDNPDAEVPESWTFKAGKDIWSTPLPVDGKLLVASLDGKLYALDESTGAEVWSFGVGSGFVSQPVVAGDKVLVGSFNSSLYAINLSDGSEAWSFTATNWVWSKPLPDQDLIYFGDFNGHVYAVDLAGGNLEWQVSGGRGPIIASPLLAGGTLIVATSDGWLMGFDPSSHEKAWERKVGTGIEADPALIDGKVIIAPRGCVTPSGADNKVYYISVDPQTGDLETALDVC